MRKSRGAATEEFGKDGSELEFHQLLKHHMERGTRPFGVPGAPGSIWTPKDLSAALGHADEGHLVRLWMRGIHTPNNLSAIERALFGGQEKWHAECVQLREAYNRARQRSTSASGARVEPYSVALAPLANKDADGCGLAHDDIFSFFLEEFKRHPGIFLTRFTSQTFEYRKCIILASFDGAKVFVERVVSDVAPEQMLKWAVALSKYRVVSVLPYRTSLGFVTSDHLEMALRQAGGLVKAAGDYLNIQPPSGSKASSVAHIEVILEEAKDYFDLGNHEQCISNLEIVLSRVHKLLVDHVPVDNGEDREVRRFPQNASAAPGINILVMEDTDLARFLICDLVQEFDEKFNILEAETIKEAFVLLVDWRIDVLFADINMAGESGLQVIRALKKSSPKAKIVVCSGVSSMYLSELEFPVDYFIQKPFKDNVIADALSKLLSIPQANHES